MEFIYKAKQGPTDIVEGKIEADSKDGAVQKLIQMNLFPVDIHPAHYEHKLKHISLHFKKKVSAKDLSVFYRQFSDLLDSGLTLVMTLETLFSQIESPLIKTALQGVISTVNEGDSLSESMKAYPNVFPPLHVNMIKSGEAGGMLENVLSRLAEFTEKQADLTAKIKTAMTYPIFLFVVGGLTIWILLTFIIPKLIPVFEDFGQVLPFPTRVLIFMSDIFVQFWWLLILIIILGVAFFKQKSKALHTKLLLDTLKLRLPLVGNLLKKSEISQMSMTLGTLLQNGVPIIQSLSILLNTIDNEVLRKDIKYIRDSVTQGNPLGDSFRQSKFFPAFVVNMISVGDKSGAMEKSLLKIALYYSKEVDQAIKTITILLEPLMILVLGAIVGFIVFAMLLPIFQMNLGIG